MFCGRVPQTVARLGEGAFFGGVALVSTNGVRTASVDADDNTGVTCLIVTRKVFMQELGQLQSVMDVIQERRDAHHVSGDYVRYCIDAACDAPSKVLLAKRQLLLWLSRVGTDGGC